MRGRKQRTEATIYRFTDEALPYAADTLAYRPRQVDSDRSAQVTDPVTVARGGVSALELEETYPNPARNRVTVRFAVPDDVGAEGDVRLPEPRLLPQGACTTERTDLADAETGSSPKVPEALCTVTSGFAHLPCQLLDVGALGVDPCVVPGSQGRGAHCRLERSKPTPFRCRRDLANEECKSTSNLLRIDV